MTLHSLNDITRRRLTNKTIFIAKHVAVALTMNQGCPVEEFEEVKRVHDLDGRLLVEVK